MKQNKASNEGDDMGAGDWIDTSPVDEMDDKEIEAANETDKDRQASDNAEIQDLAREVD